MRKNSALYPILMVVLLFMSSCSSDNTSNDEQGCSLHSIGEEGEFFTIGNYDFSCMTDGGSLTTEFPVLGNSYRVLAPAENATEYIISATHKTTADKAYSDFEIFKVFGDSASETIQVIENLGDEAYFYMIRNGNTLQHYLVLVDCNFVSTISGEYDSTDTEPCNLGQDAFVQFAKEMINNI